MAVELLTLRRVAWVLTARPGITTLGSAVRESLELVPTLAMLAGGVLAATAVAGPIGAFAVIARLSAQRQARPADHADRGAGDRLPAGARGDGARPQGRSVHLMRMRPLGSTGLEVSELAIGTWAFGGDEWGGADDAVAVATIRAALAAGITLIDTADVYGYGHSEELVADALEGAAGDVLVCSKAGNDIYETPREAGGGPKRFSAGISHGDRGQPAPPSARGGRHLPAPQPEPRRAGAGRGDGRAARGARRRPRPLRRCVGLHRGRGPGRDPGREGRRA